MHGKFHQENNFRQFRHPLSLINDCIEDDHIGKNLFHQIEIFLRGSWSWRNICLANISTYTVVLTNIFSVVVGGRGIMTVSA